MRASMRGLVAVGAAAGAVLIAAAPAMAETVPPVNTLTLNATASGTDGITAGGYFTPDPVAPGETTSLELGVTQPANICRTVPAGQPGSCPPGYPNSGAVLTISGLSAAGLTFTGNADTAAGCVQSGDTVTCHYQYYNNNHKSDNFKFTESPTAAGGSYTIDVNVLVFSKALPTSKSQCKDGGWASFYDALDNPVFRNQGSCVSYVATGGKHGA